MQIYYWCPYLTNIATIKSVIRSAKSLKKYTKLNLGEINEVTILNDDGTKFFKKELIIVVIISPWRSVNSFLKKALYKVDSHF